MLSLWSPEPSSHCSSTVQAGRAFSRPVMWPSQEQAKKPGLRVAESPVPLSGFIVTASDKAGDRLLARLWAEWEEVRGGGWESTQLSGESVLSEAASTLGLHLPSGSPLSPILSILHSFPVGSPRHHLAGQGGAFIMHQSCHLIFSQIISDLAFPSCPARSGGLK